MTTGLMGPLEECRNTVARHDILVFIAWVGLTKFLLLLVDQDRFQALIEALVDILELVQLLNLSESI